MAEQRTSTTAEVKENYVTGFKAQYRDFVLADFNRWLKAELAAAEQKGYERGLDVGTTNEKARQEQLQREREDQLQWDRDEAADRGETLGVKPGLFDFAQLEQSLTMAIADGIFNGMSQLQSWSRPTA